MVDRPLLRPVVLTIGGSDSAALAGVQADLRTITALGGHAITAITAITAQNSQGVLAATPVDAHTLQQQLIASLALAPSAIKIGLLTNAEQVHLCADFIAAEHQLNGLPMVLDPVLASSSGHPLAAAEVVSAIRQRLLPQCTVITPNRSEATALTARPLTALEQVPQLASAIALDSPAAVYLKGGHWQGDTSSDYFCHPQQSFWLTSPRHRTPHQRGTGCTFAAATATALAQGYSLADALVIAKMAVNQGLRQSYGWPTHSGPLSVSHFPDCGSDLPVLSDRPLASLDTAGFPTCGPTPLGLYPIVNRAHWLKQLLPTGISTIQLRIKDLEPQALRTEIQQAIAIAQHYRARLFINDHWQLALELGAYGVHLGQDDLARADIPTLQRAGLRLGISTHCHHEVARAIGFRPSYLACGPIYPTTSKIMPWVPHGPAGLSYWRRVLNDQVLVAIGGINRQRLSSVKAAGADGIAMISALTQARDPAAAAIALLASITAESAP